MDREIAMSKYKEDIAVILPGFRTHMANHIQERSQQLESTIKAAVDELGDRMVKQQKEYVSFLYISMLKTNLIQKNYQFLLQAANFRWYLDDELIEVYFSAEDLLEPLEKLWNELSEKSHIYRGAINQYDIQHIIFEELSFIDAVISQVLRYQLRNWEEKEIFSKITLSPYWFLKWGEYQDQTEFIIHTDRTEKDESIWRRELKKAIHKPETMVFSYWYRGEYEDRSIKALDMRFIVFEDSKLKGIEFQQCNMEGSKFRNCNIAGCSFEGCNLYGADFTNCTFKHVSFPHAELEEAIFPAHSVPFLDLTPEQLQTIRLAKEEIG